MQKQSQRYAFTLSAIEMIVLIGSCLVATWFALATLGLFPTIGVKNPDLGKFALLGVVVEHAFIGLILLVGVIASGCSIVGLLASRCGLIARDTAMAGLPIGTLYWLIIGVVVRAAELPGWLSIVFGYGLPLLLSLLAFRRHGRDADRQRIWPAFRVAGTPVMLAFISSAITGLLWRFPSTVAVGTVDLGDIGQYVAAYHSLRLSLSPFLLLGVEGEASHVYFNLIGPFLAFAFDFIPGFEISFFLTTSFTVFFFLGTCWCVYHILMYRKERGLPVLDGMVSSAAILLITVGTRYPSWYSESPPYAVAVPLALALVYLAERGGTRLAWLAALLPLTTIAFIISKVVVLAVLGTYIFCLFAIRLLQSSSRRGWLITGCVLLLFAIFVAGMLAFYGPKFLAIASGSDFGPPSLQILYRKIFVNGSAVMKSLLHSFPALAMDIAGLLLALGALYRKNLALGIAVLIGVLLYYAYAFLFNGTLAIAAMLVAAHLFLCESKPRAGNPAPALLQIAGCLLLFSHLTRDPGEWGYVAIWSACLIGALTFTVIEVQGIEITTPKARRIGAGWPFALCLAGLMAVVAEAQGSLRLGPAERAIVSADLYDLWVNVRNLTPPDALIFTDQTGDTPSRLVGWNDLSLSSERQFYISSWLSSPFRHNVAARTEQLTRNTAILTGEMRPDQLQLHRRYSAYYLAMRADRPAPSAAERIYSNGGYSLYRIPN
jgi:hypothetical protein